MTERQQFLFIELAVAIILLIALIHGWGGW